MPIGEAHVYSPSTDKQGNLYSVPLPAGQDKIQHGGIFSSNSVLIDLEPLNQKLMKIRKRLKENIESCRTIVEQYKKAEGGKEYSYPYKLSADFLQQNLDSLDKEFPELKEPE